MNITTITYQCEVITPLFLAGADQGKPELRAPSIKGSMRFWFRAIHGHFARVADLQAEESKYLGSTERQSPLRLRCKALEPWRTKRIPMLPHRTDRGSSPAQAIMPGSRFWAKLSVPTQLADKYAALFELSVFLGGLGRRSRRGAGCVRINSQEIDGQAQSYTNPSSLADVQALLAPWTNYYELRSNALQFTFGGNKIAYPWLRQIEIGTYQYVDQQELRSHIGQVTHDLKRDSKAAAYEASMGHASRGRFASPIYTSAFQQNDRLHVVVSTLNTVPDRASHEIDSYLQEEYRGQVF